MMVSVVCSFVSPDLIAVSKRQSTYGKETFVTNTPLLVPRFQDQHLRLLANGALQHTSLNLNR
jgi:hypothetical protein